MKNEMCKLLSGDPGRLKILSPLWRTAAGEFGRRLWKYTGGFRYISDCIQCTARDRDGQRAAGGKPATVSDPYAQYQNAQNYGSGDQNTYTSDYQNNQYQTPPVYQSSYEPEKPINWVPYLVLSIITTLCCCLPFGIVGIVYSTKINSAVNARDWEGAQKAAKTAKIWIIASAIVGFIVEVIYVVMIYAGIAGSGYYYY